MFGVPCSLFDILYLACVSRAEISINTLQPGADCSGFDLLAALSPEFFAYTIVDAEGNLKLFEKYTRSTRDAQNFSFDTEGEWLSRTYRQVKVAYFSPDTVTMPSRYFQPGNAAIHLDTVYGDTREDILLNDFITHRSVYCVYRVPKDVVRTVVRSFPLATAWNAQSLLLAQKNNNEGVSLQVTFLQDACCFLLQKNGQLLSVKSYPYTHVPDVAFTLLGFCQLHGIAAADVRLNAGGWITGGSPMYEELRKYFLHTGFSECPPAPQGFEQFPPHFFELFHLLRTV